MSIDRESQQPVSLNETSIEAVGDAQWGDDDIEAFDLDDIEVIESKVFG